MGVRFPPGAPRDKKIYGGYSLVAKRWVVVPLSRVRFPLATPLKREAIGLAFCYDIIVV